MFLGQTFTLPLDVAGKPAFHSGMKRILIFIFITVFSISAAFAQDSATQQQIDQLSGRIQDLLEGQARQGKQLDALAKEISELREKVNAPVINDSASRDDLKKLAEQVQDIDKKRQADKELILKNLESLGKAGGEVPTTTTHGRNKKPTAPKNDAKTDVKDEPPTGGPQIGHEYKVQAGDSLGLIVKAYRDQGVKVTTAQILKANPGLDPDKLYVGKKIFIPDPAAK